MTGTLYAWKQAFLELGCSVEPTFKNNSCGRFVTCAPVTAVWLKPRTWAADSIGINRGEVAPRLAGVNIGRTEYEYPEFAAPAPGCPWQPPMAHHHQLTGLRRPAAGIHLAGSAPFFEQGDALVVVIHHTASSSGEDWPIRYHVWRVDGCDAHPNRVIILRTLVREHRWQF